jgi:hypothetical protein
MIEGPSYRMKDKIDEQQSHESTHSQTGWITPSSRRRPHSSAVRMKCRPNPGERRSAKGLRGQHPTRIVNLRPESS